MIKLFPTIKQQELLWRIAFHSKSFSYQQGFLRFLIWQTIGAHHMAE